MRSLGLVVALVALSAGCNGLILGETTPTATPAPTPDPATPTPGPRNLAPGITEFGVANPDRLARSHERALRDRSYMWVERRVETPVRRNATERWTLQRITIVENRTRFRRTTTRSFYGNNNTSTILQQRSILVTNGTAFERLRIYTDDARYWTHPTNRTSDQFANVSSGRVAKYLSVTRSNVTVTEYRGRKYYLVRGCGLERKSTYPVYNYTVRALVSDSGFVRSLTVEYVNVLPGPSRRVHYHFEYREIGLVTVENPVWISTVRNGTTTTDSDLDE